MDIYFMSANESKIEEVVSILNSSRITVHAVPNKIKEIQSSDMEEIAVKKVLEAFREIGRPVFVEHTGLLIKEFGNLPGGLTQLFWDALEADKFSNIFTKAASTEAIARTVVAFCDGKKVYTFKGEIEGHIVCPPRGSRVFQWDCVFEPNGYDETFAELGERKNEISMRRAALEQFKEFLERKK